MGYRPDGWNSENIAKESLPLFKWGTQEYALVIKGIEIGADAYEEGLKKAPGSHRILPQDKDYLSELYPSQIGWLVFIPDEKDIDVK